MINAKDLYYSALTGNAALTTLIGGSSHISSAYPETVTVFPLVAFTDDNQIDSEYADNRPTASNVSVRVDIFTKNTSDMPTTWAIGELVYNVFSALDFNCGINGEVPDPTDGVRHRVMRFSREVIS